MGYASEALERLRAEMEPHPDGCECIRCHGHTLHQRGYSEAQYAVREWHPKCETCGHLQEGDWCREMSFDFEWLGKDPATHGCLAHTALADPDSPEKPRGIP